MKATGYKTELQSIKERIIEDIKKILNDSFNGRWELTKDDEEDELKEETEIYEIVWLLKSIFTEDNRLLAEYKDSYDGEIKVFMGEFMNLNRLLDWLERLERLQY